MSELIDIAVPEGQQEGTESTLMKWPDARAYLDGLCVGEFVESLCISPNDPNLMRQLHGDFWLDPSHLLDGGTAIYNAWLVDQIVASGVLEGAQ